VVCDRRHWLKVSPSRLVRLRHTPQSLLDLQTAQVARLRATAQRYPADQTVPRLIDELRARSDLFATLWDSGTVDDHQLASRKTVDHPEVGATSTASEIRSLMPRNRFDIEALGWWHG
jgi:MmyB-like transcription regulator ligand binding domain